jgi:hypothetical protein
MLKDALNNVLNCIITSSSDPNEVSLTIKSLLITAVPSIMFALGIAHVNLGQDQSTAIIDAFITFVQAVLTVVGALITLCGAFRKAWNTMFSSN